MVGTLNDAAADGSRAYTDGKRADGDDGGDVEDGGGTAAAAAVDDDDDGCCLRSEEVRVLMLLLWERFGWSWRLPEPLPPDSPTLEPMRDDLIVA